MMPNPADLNYFAEVANTCNLSRAAERLGVTQPAISFAIARLESCVGVGLLIRTKTGVTLTRAGQKFAIEARHLISEWERIQSEASRDDSEASGRYTLGCNAALAAYALPRFLPQLMRHFPGIEINVVHGLSREMTEDVISFKSDFAIVVNPPRHPDLVIKELFSDQVTLWASRPSAKTRFEHCDPFSEHSVVIYSPVMPQAQAILKLASKHKMKFGRAITSSNLEVITSLTASGAGIGIIPTNVATRMKGYGLVKACKNPPSISDRINLVYRADCQRSPASRQMATFIKKCFESNKTNFGV